jgi:malate dehydrogenase
MITVAVLGAGELGGAVAQALAASDSVTRVILIDAAASAAAGKALDIQQMGAVDAFHTRLEGTDDASRITGCRVCVVADRFGGGEWSGEDAGPILKALAAYASGTAVVCAGARQDTLVWSAVRDARLPRDRVLGSAPDAFAAAVRAMVAMEAHVAPSDVLLTALGTAGRLVVPFGEASIGGYALNRVLSAVQISRLEARAARLWPPGPYALGASAARIVGALVHDGRNTYSVLTMLDGEFGVRNRVGALPVLLGGGCIQIRRIPVLDTRERVRLETSLGAP